MPYFFPIASNVNARAASMPKRLAIISRDRCGRSVHNTENAVENENSFSAISLNSVIVNISRQKDVKKLRVTIPQKWQNCQDLESVDLFVPLVFFKSARIDRLAGFQIG